MAIHLAALSRAPPLSMSQLPPSLTVSAAASASASEAQRPSMPLVPPPSSWWLGSRPRARLTEGTRGGSRAITLTSTLRKSLLPPLSHSSPSPPPLPLTSALTGDGSDSVRGHAPARSYIDTRADATMSTNVRGRETSTCTCTSKSTRTCTRACTCATRVNCAPSLCQWQHIERAATMSWQWTGREGEWPHHSTRIYAERPPQQQPHHQQHRLQQRQQTPKADLGGSSTKRALHPSQATWWESSQNLTSLHRPQLVFHQQQQKQQHQQQQHQLQQQQEKEEEDERSTTPQAWRAPILQWSQCMPDHVGRVLPTSLANAATTVLSWSSKAVAAAAIAACFLLLPAPEIAPLPSATAQLSSAVSLPLATPQLGLHIHDGSVGRGGGSGWMWPMAVAAELGTGGGDGGGGGDGNGGGKSGASSSGEGAATKLPPLESPALMRKRISTMPEFLGDEEGSSSSAADPSEAQKQPAKQRIQRPKSAAAQRCVGKCVTTCIRGGAGAPGEGPLNIRKPLVVFKDQFRSRKYCLVECTDICNLLPDGADGI